MASPHSPAMDTTTGSHPSTPADGPARRSADASVAPTDRPVHRSADASIAPSDRPARRSDPLTAPSADTSTASSAGPSTTRSPRHSPRPGYRPGPPYRREDHHSTALTHALVAAGRGYAVIPLTRAKLPAVRSPHHADQATAPCRGACGQLGHGIHDATADPLAVRRLFAAAPWATAYGIACGVPPYHLIGIDLDTKHGADGLTALRLLAEEHHVALPPTVTVRTPSGGHHLYFSGPPTPPVPNSAGRLAPGIDIRGTGGYLVGPGSHTSVSYTHLRAHET
ncbi:bifunctional DNA primase/polymerase, partial [Streptomyces sp. NRRL B-11253]|uniref:bifunctional DNA primase/polymerase n=1 Tax=Streptomyces sp. NRRL B-11253 TaxID=1463826 RepID=UPI001F1921C5